MKECAVRESENLRLLGRMDRQNDPICLDWTASGFEVRFKGSELWVELEATTDSPDVWAACAVDGYPIARFMVEKTRRFYPLVHGMDPETTRTVALLKESQAMPDHPESTLRVYSIRYEGELLPLPEPSMRIEFVGDSLTSAEGVLAPRGNNEWLPMWFSACANYSHYACRALNAERRVLSQSGHGVCWDWQFKKERNMADGYTKIAGTLHGPEADKRGLSKPYDFSSWKADFVCIRLLSNDLCGMNSTGRAAEMTPVLRQACVDFVKKVRACNPTAQIIWIMPGSTPPEFGVEAIDQCLKDGLTGVSFFNFPNYTQEDMGARSHPGASYNERVGLLLADHIRSLADKKA